MTKKKATESAKQVESVFRWAEKSTIDAINKESTHVYGDRHICRTDEIGFAFPRNRSPLELVVDASEGFIPLWEQNTVLNWRFNERSLRNFVDPEESKKRIRELIGKAVMAWGNAVPVKFRERSDLWDFEISVRELDDCTTSGCVLASAFFPDGGRHELTIYPRMFQESEHEQIDTLAHEMGHIFGLRHFFAKVSETAWPSEVFGQHKPFSIMNYGANSEMTDDDRSDLQSLYRLVWSGQLTQINGTPIRLVRPYHAV
ncbi:MAG: matrix metalloproteinase-11 [Candidatus Contendobacter sp.]|nr:matrix metalloproteinase-11 [Candidatus Contendobacter sp.]